MDPTSNLLCAWDSHVQQNYEVLVKGKSDGCYSLKGEELFTLQHLHLIWSVSIKTKNLMSYQTAGGNLPMFALLNALTAPCSVNGSCYVLAHDLHNMS